MAVLSALGLSFLMEGEYLLVLTIVFLCLALFALGFRAKHRQGYGPFILGILSALAIVLGKFVIGFAAVWYTGLGLLVIASIWNILPVRITKRFQNSTVDSAVACPQCLSNSATEKGEIIMPSKRLIEVFTAGCPVCDEAVEKIKSIACDSCQVKVYDLNKGCATNECREKAEKYGIKSVPAVVIDGKLAECCKDRGIDIEALKSAGLGKAIKSCCN